MPNNCERCRLGFPASLLRLDEDIRKRARVECYRPCLCQEILEPEDRSHRSDDHENEPHNNSLADEKTFPALGRREVVHRLAVDR